MRWLDNECEVDDDADRDVDHDDNDAGFDVDDDAVDAVVDGDEADGINCNGTPPALIISSINTSITISTNITVHMIFNRLQAVKKSTEAEKQENNNKTKATSHKKKKKKRRAKTNFPSPAPRSTSDTH